MRANRQGRIDGLRTVMKKIKRPDVIGAASKINPRGRGRVDVHGAL
jgi:hypothetical protein